MATDYCALLKKYMKFVFESAGTDYMFHSLNDEFSAEEVKALRELSDEAYLEVR